MPKMKWWFDQNVVNKGTLRSSVRSIRCNRKLPCATLGDVSWTFHQSPIDSWYVVIWTPDCVFSQGKRSCVSRSLVRLCPNYVSREGINFQKQCHPKEKWMRKKCRRKPVKILGGSTLGICSKQADPMTRIQRGRPHKNPDPMTLHFLIFFMNTKTADHFFHVFKIRNRFAR